MKKKNNSYVTRAECAQISNSIRADLNILKDALIGRDLRSGIVRDIRDLQNSVQEILTAQREAKENEKLSRETLTRYKLALLSFVFTVLGVVLGRIIEIFW